MSRNQLNVRVTPQIEAVIDAKRIELAKTQGSIPTRSDVVRLALEEYLGVSFDVGADADAAPARLTKSRKRTSSGR